MSCYYTDTLSHCFIKYTPTAWWCSSLQHFTSVASFLHLLLISSSCLTKLSMCDRKDQAFSKLPQSESWWPFKCCRVAFEVKKRKKSWGEGVKKNCPPSLSLLFPLFVPLWTCCPWMRHKGSGGERTKNRCKRHTNLFTEPAAEPNAQSPPVCVYVGMHATPTLT